MRREPLFSRSGYYRFLLECNALLHRQAAAATRAVLAERLEPIVPGRTVRVLDLACGGLPLTIAEVMGAFPAYSFDYTGVDLNPDQVAEAGRYRFPANVTASRVLEGNAWDLDALGVGEGFDLVYSGMNLHHGTPEELCFLGLQLLRLLARPGIFVSHDVYRPSDTPYRRRPDANPADPGESWRLVRKKRLCRAGVLASAVPEDLSPEEPAWRLDYLGRMGETLIARGGDWEGAESTVAHMRERDYPISPEELCRIFGNLGFRADARYYDAPEEPMAPYIAFCTAALDDTT
jgi:SAM-dependent methyltransferase